MCKNCIHKLVCGKFRATGGHVNFCEHHREDRRGHWIKRGNEKKCSVCGFIYYSNQDEWNGCPNCLADMRGEKNDLSRV